MKAINGVIQFKGYRVIDARYSVNDVKLEEGSKVELKTAFQRKIRKNSDDVYSLILGVKVGDENGDCELPFFAKVEIEGMFTLSGVDNPEEMMKINAVAILFPYLRSTLSILTSIANINPVILPTINLVQMFEKEQEETVKND